MKKQFFAATLALLFVGVSAQAQTTTYVRLTGSTAYRTATHQGILRALGSSSSSNFTPSTAGVFGYTGTSFTGASQAIFRGSVAGVSGTVVVKTSWSGSVGGIATVSNSLAPNSPFIPDSALASCTSTGASGLSNSGGDTTVPNACMSDTFQGSVFPAFQQTGLTQSLGTPVGVVPFVFVASASAPSSITNITPQQVRALFGGNGKLPLSYFTGSAADTTSVYAIGRDFDSGTRLTAFAETGLGAVSTVSQFSPTISGTTITTHALWPQTTINGIVSIAGNGGYASGGTLAGVMRNTSSALNGFYITYVSTGDATTAVQASGSGAPGKLLTYNGNSIWSNATTPTYDFTNLYNGLYTFWGYENLYYNATGGAEDTVSDAIATAIKSTTATVLLSNVKVNRSDDGATVFPGGIN